MHHQLQNAGQIKILRQRNARPTQRARQPANQPLLQMGTDVIHKLLETQFDSVNQIAQELNGAADNFANGLGRPRQHIEQHLF